MEHKTLRTSFLIILALSLLLIVITAEAKTPMVHAFLFYSDTCPHCHKVITEDLTPLIDMYDEQLVILGINTYSEQGYQLYQEAITQFQIPKERWGVPTLIVGETVLVGSMEIPTQFPGIVEQRLKSGNGIEWPDLPRLKEILEARDNAETETDTSDTEDNTDKETDASSTEPKRQSPDSPERSIPAVGEVAGVESFEESASLEDDQVGAGIDFQKGDETSSEKVSISQRFTRDKVGNTLSVFVLLGMVLSVVGVGKTIVKPGPWIKQWPDWAIPILVFIGICVAIYMGYVEITHSEAVCGPVGDCNTVQQSSYAYLFGIIPIGAFGVIGYILIGFVWLVFYRGPSGWRKMSTYALWGFAVFGTLFSIYLTFLEPFVIGATCAWCLTSAILMTLLLWASTSQHIEAWTAKE